MPQKIVQRDDKIFENDKFWSIQISSFCRTIFCVSVVLFRSQPTFILWQLLNISSFAIARKNHFSTIMRIVIEKMKRIVPKNNCYWKAKQIVPEKELSKKSRMTVIPKTRKQRNSSRKIIVIKKLKEIVLEKENLLKSWKKLFPKINSY